MVGMKNQLITKQGESGKEMYMVMSGEVEVLEDGKRLGFLSEGAFFGESPILGFGEAGTETRRRTVMAVTETELCYVTRDSIEEICNEYSELRARLARFANAAKPMNAKRLKQAGLTRTDLSMFSSDCEFSSPLFLCFWRLSCVVRFKFAQSTSFTGKRFNAFRSGEAHHDYENQRCKRSNA